ncbi:hypothetical protein TNCV_1091361 [Trichonephila clavipes]|nr:hypothetical protein TNCV_1091361 [Trichonephila clavipes]
MTLFLGLLYIVEKLHGDQITCHLGAQEIEETINLADGHIEEITGSQNAVPAATPKTPSATGPTTPVNQNTAKPLPSPVSCLG